MANLEDEIRDLREKNSELVQEVQYLKIADAQRQKENLELMRENNELRLKLSRLKSGGEAQARKLDSALQSASANALSHLVQASGAIARTIELTKQYIQERQELESASPRWSATGSSPSTDKVHKVPPLLLGGQSIQPVVALSRTILDSSTRSVPRTPNHNSSVTERAVPIPMHMLQDLYIPLQRIDLAELQGSNTETEQEADVDDINDSNEQSLLADESNNLSRVDELEESS
ncbi:uncharacterized protein LOC113232546 [Hyposmocoma kahamanoa]|uniref:uncharacterized protein LOC113232546 n=1 Tax=Hyposmocoma kahamanoa TaxID=1477025 RepID=UPI000E6D998E|nr:uncharacterized protein LOC113232546 [Hyposmocoma kahamanoa]